MKTFEFKGDWETSIEMEMHSRLNSTKFFQPNSHLEWRRTIYENLQKKMINLRIQDEINENPDPEIEQLNTINYILNNDEQLYQKIYEAFKNEVVKDFLSYEHYAIDEQTFHLIESIEELPNYIGIQKIHITNLYKEDYAFHVYFFDFDGDHEHGLCMIFWKDQFLRHDEIGGFTFEGLVPDKEYEDLVKKINRRPEKRFYPPSIKYNKNKPWEYHENVDFIVKLLKEGSNNKIKKLIEDGYLIKDTKIGSSPGTLMEFACSCNNYEIIDYLSNKNWSFGDSIVFCTRGQFNHNTIKYIVSKGANIDALNHNKQTILFNEIYNFSKSSDDYNRQKSKDEERAAKHEKEIDLHLDNIKFLLDLGANPNKCDHDGNNYQKILLTRWNSDYLERIGILVLLQSLIVPKSKKWWKFW